ncbi:hypothetical protein FDECE_15857 [Fusarium decemcellulare]|nr:hypothetical protein FDECE_15857 [Fusarium decemcellulare]
MTVLPRGYDTWRSQVCTEPACLRIAADILGNLATNYTEIDPCTDFDQYACGNWAAHNAIPAGETSTDTLGQVQADVYESVRLILEGSYPSKEEGGWITVDLTDEQVTADKENFAKLQGAYEACTNYTALAEQDLTSLKVVASEIVSTFPALPCPGGNPKNITYDHSAYLGPTLALFESVGVETVQRFFQIQNKIDPDEMVLSLQVPKDSGLPASTEFLPEYIRLATELLIAVHPINLTQKRAAELIEGVINIQVEIGKASEYVDKTDSPLPAYKSLAEIQQLAPQLNYEAVIQRLAPADYDTSKIGLSAPKWLQHISLVFSKTPADVIQAFFVWRAIVSLSPYIESDLTNAYNAFRLKQAGADVESPQPRWRRCVTALDGGALWIQSDDIAREAIGPTGLTWIVSRFFVDKHFSAEARNLTAQMVDNLESSFLDRIETRDWATETVKKAATEKVHAMASQIALPMSPDAADPLKINAYYSDVVITESLATNVLSAAKSNIAKNWASLGKPTDRDMWKFSTLTTNAFHYPPLNEMVLLAGVLQYPLLDVDFPAYLLYGGVGSVIGHEITHGFDNNGRLYDKTGNYTTWWDEKSIEGFVSKTKCFIEEYNKYTVIGPDGEPTHVDGELTLGENLADAGGVASSYNAWKKLVSANGKDKNLPGMDGFTHDQLFFLKWGQAWCQNIRPADLVENLKDVHSPNRARILLTLQNSPGFGKAFKCPPKKPACELW